MDIARSLNLIRQFQKGIRQLRATVHSFPAFEDSISRLQEKFPNESSLEAYLKHNGPDGAVKEEPFQDGITRVVLNNPRKRNALTGKMMVDFRHAFRRIRVENKTKAVLVSGMDGTFCSGGDLGFVKKIASDEGAYVMSTYMEAAVREMAENPQLNIAVLEGHTLGGGSELASACDLRIAHKDATVGFVQGRVGVSPGWGGGKYIVEALGRARAMEYLCMARTLSADELYRIGYVSFVYSEQAELQEFVNRINTVPLRPFCGAKRVVWGYTSGEVDGKQEEQKVFMGVWGKDDHMKSVNAVLESIAKKKKK